MTCIAAIVDRGIVWMGGDSAGVDDGLGLVHCAEPKVWINHRVLFGAFGSFRIAQALRFKMDVPVRDPDADPLEFVIGPLVDSMREALEGAGALSVWDEDQTIEMHESGLLVAVGGRLFDVFSDFGVGEYVDGYAAVGCGGPYALGSLHSTTHLKPRKRILAALAAATRFSAGVHGPYVVEALS